MPKVAPTTRKKVPAVRNKVPSVKEMVRGLEESGLKVQLVGRVKNGQLLIDQESLKALSDRFPNANMTFVAVNAPFDPVSDPAV